MTSLSAPPLSSFTAAILAGGMGTRLRTAIGERQKVAAEVAERPFVAYLLDQLARAGVCTTVLCTGYRAGEVARQVGDSHWLPEAGGAMRIVHSVEPEPLGTAGALRNALEHFHSPRVLVLNGDSYCGVDLHAFVAAVMEAEREGAAGGIVLVHQEKTASYGRVELDERGFVTRFVEKGSENGPGWINAGVYLLDRDLIAEIPAGRAVSLEREMFPQWIARGLVGYRCEAAFLDIGTPERYAAAQEFVRKLSVED